MRLPVLAVVVGTFLLCGNAVQAEGQKRIVVTGGANFASFSGDADEIGDSFAAGLEVAFPGTTWSAETNQRTGIDVGAELVIPLTPVIGIQPGLHYAQRGGKWSFDETSGTGISADGTFQLSYIDVPVLLRIAPPTDSKVQVFFNIGPALDFRVTSDFEVEAEGSSSSMDISDELTAVDFAGVGGLGVDFGISPTTALVLQGRYYLGFSNILEDSGDLSMKNSDWHLSAGFSKAFGGPK